MVEDAFAEVTRIEELMSTYIESSEISQINRAAAEAPVAAGDELIQLILRSLDISMLTRGAFDITYDSVGQYYDFRERQRPDAETIEEELKRIDYRLVEVDRLAGTVRFLAPGVRINLGGIAKGYAVERAVSLLRSRGIRHAIVTAGGDSRLLGDRLGQPFMVGIRDPRKEDEVALTIPLEDEAISTSGDYERYFEEDGQRYHHIIEPATGLPADESLLSDKAEHIIPREPGAGKQAYRTSLGTRQDQRQGPRPQRCRGGSRPVVESYQIFGIHDVGHVND